MSCRIPEDEIGMSKTALVTGAAGFIGSHLCQRLMERGWDVVGLDNLCDTYSPEDKKSNLEAISLKSLRFLEADILDCPLEELLSDVDVVAHLAAIAGVRTSWGESFAEYAHTNIIGTERLLAACAESQISKLVYASSSSVYGDTDQIPMTEDALPAPISPYGVSKLAGEHLCTAYRKNSALSVTCLRYFTVYGPRQRPDMAFRRFCEAILDGKPIRIYGDGSQSRDFTFVGDAVEATLSAIEHDGAEGIFNIGGGSRVSVLDSLEMLSSIAGTKLDIVFEKRQRGDVRLTEADTTRARSILGFAPAVGIESGLEKEFLWVRSRRDSGGG
jgi:UDP-glucose 4-epimerase